MSRRRGLLAPGLLALVLLPPALLAGGFLAFLQAVAAPPEQPGTPTDALVVLTGGAERVETAFRLLGAGLAAQVLVSGVHPETTLADLARLAGVETGALAGRVALGRAAQTTRGNALEAAAWLAAAPPEAPVRLVTSDYHLPRARLELRRALRGRPILAHPVTTGRPRDATLLLGEYLKLIGAWSGLTRLREVPLAPA